jgi:hypothetical protein
MMARLSPFFPAMVVAFGALVAAAGGFWASLRQSNFNMELREKSEEIARLQRENASLITGGDSFAYASFQIFSPDGTNINAYAIPDEVLLNPLIIHKGQYPLYDVAVRFADFRMQPIDTSPTYPIGEIPVGVGTMTKIQLQHPGKANDIEFNIFFSARNGLWDQFLRMRWVGNGWASANKVMRGSKEIYREVSANFPRQQDGSVDWRGGPERAAQDAPKDHQLTNEQSSAPVRR